MYEKISEVKPDKVREKLIEHKDQAFLCKKLATICTDMTLPIAADELIPSTPDASRLAELYRELEFHSLLKKLGNTAEIKTSSATNYNMVKTTKEHFTSGNIKLNGIFHLPKQTDIPFLPGHL